MTVGIFFFIFNFFFYFLLNGTLFTLEIQIVEVERIFCSWQSFVLARIIFIIQVRMLRILQILIKLY
jgi:hypothetical protein